MENQYREEDSLKRGLGQFANLRGWLGKKGGSVFEGGGGGGDTPLHIMLYTWIRVLSIIYAFLEFFRTAIFCSISEQNFSQTNFCMLSQDTTLSSSICFSLLCRYYGGEKAGAWTIPNSLISSPWRYQQNPILNSQCHYRNFRIKFHLLKTIWS